MLFTVCIVTHSLTHSFPLHITQLEHRDTSCLMMSEAGMVCPVPTYCTADSLYCTCHPCHLCTNSNIMQDRYI